jgi:putative two-component system response regulator
VLWRTAIPIEGRIVAIADVFDALTNRRPYKEPFPVDKAIDIMTNQIAEHFDPDLFQIFLDNIGEILRIKTEVDSELVKIVSTGT